MKLALLIVPLVLALAAASSAAAQAPASQPRTADSSDWVTVVDADAIVDPFGTETHPPRPLPIIDDIIDPWTATTALHYESIVDPWST